ncbi:uncharacterized protein LOC119091816 [Pollicipes pollicipes]|uniref:uncharacterized protein LOC119091816 n=1 Tax=Pollicipes pollicipes TaxID=41117 RepID=UPI001885453D|nr:uncharacterized protein LOC119091816 [Pollicipes pollicipes]
MACSGQRLGAPLEMTPLLLVLVLLSLLKSGASYSACSSERACVVSPPQTGAVRRGACVDISATCQELDCSADQPCALDPSGHPVCLPANATRAPHCGSEDERLEQPCPEGATLLGFGCGCTYCSDSETTPSPPTPRGERQDLTSRACMLVHMSGGSVKECADVASQCREKHCPNGTVCGLNLDEEPECFPASVKNFKNCSSEELRLSRPCPADSRIRGYGEECTFCVDGNSSETFVDDQTRKACVVIDMGSGQFKTECIDISSQCQQKSCPNDTVCGLTQDEELECFPASAKELENCGSEEFRLSQPCPADSRVRGFGQGCTFCVGGNSSETLGDDQAGKACVVIHMGSGEWKKECIDISTQCQQKSCPNDTVCALSPDEQLECFPLSSVGSKNCGAEDLRLSQPCPENVDILGFGQNCTLCRASGPIPALTRAPTPTPTWVPTPVQIRTPKTTRPLPETIVCLVHNARYRCVDISRQCIEKACGQNKECALTVKGQVVCVSRKTKNRRCGAEEQWRLQPCEPGLVPLAFSSKCAYCFPLAQTSVRPIISVTARPATRPPRRPATSPPPRLQACWNEGNAVVCGGILAICQQMGCPGPSRCVWNANGYFICLLKRNRIEQYSQCTGYGRQEFLCPRGWPPRTARVFTGRCTNCPLQKAMAKMAVGHMACLPQSDKGTICVDVAEWCALRPCRQGFECAWDVRKGIAYCLSQNQRSMFRYCGDQLQRQRHPCGKRPFRSVRFYGQKCNYCS